eukprot:scaffold63599_cov32-Phaeocystis_antarctica.AAC.1
MLAFKKSHTEAYWARPATLYVGLRQGFTDQSRSFNSTAAVVMVAAVSDGGGGGGGGDGGTGEGWQALRRVAAEHHPPERVGAPFLRRHACSCAPWRIHASRRAFRTTGAARGWIVSAGSRPSVLAGAHRWPELARCMSGASAQRLE